VKHTALIALTLGLLAPLAAQAAQDLPTLYQAYEEAGNSTLSMEELNQTVTFSAVALASPATWRANRSLRPATTRAMSWPG